MQQRPSSASGLRSSTSSPEVIFLQSLDARARPGSARATRPDGTLIVPWIPAAVTNAGTPRRFPPSPTSPAKLPGSPGAPKPVASWTPDPQSAHLMINGEVFPTGRHHGKYVAYYFLGASARFDDIIRSGSVAPNTALEIHVEHCANCEGHSTTTKHVPGQYDRAFASLASAIQDAVGNTFPVEIVANQTFRPRVGAFEVDLIFAAKGGARTTVVLFSKLQLKRFPHPAALATFLTQQLSLVRQVNIDLICISAFTGKCPENPNVWAFSLLPSDADGEQVKAGVVQSSGIVSLSSVPFGQYQVKLVADMKGHPASVSALFNADDKTCRRICLPIPDRPLPALCAMVTVTWNMDERDSQPVSLFVRTNQGLLMHPNTGTPYNGPHQPIVHASGCLSAIIVGPVAFHVYCKLDTGLDVKRLNCCVAITLSDAQGYFVANHSYLLEGGPQSQAFWDVASVNIAEHAASSSATTLRDDHEDEENVGQEVEVAPTEVEDAVSWEVEGKNHMVDDEPYMNLVQLLVVDEAGVGLKGAKITIGTGGGKSSVVVAHLTTDKNGVATIRLPWAAYELAYTPNLAVKSQENLRCLFNRSLQISSKSTGIVGIAVAVEPPALNEVVIAACGPGGHGLDLAVEKAGCDAVGVQTKWSEGGVNNRNAIFCPSVGASTFRLLGLKEGVVARVNACASENGATLAGSWVSVLANKGSRNLEEIVFSADHACTSPNWAVCSIDDLLTITKIDNKTTESPAGGAAVVISCVTVKPEDNELVSAALLEIFEGTPSSSDKNLGAVQSVYSASDSGDSSVFLNWGSYWAVYQGQGLFKSSFPFDVMRGRDNRISVPMCALVALGPKQARLVLTWSPCLLTGVDLVIEGPAGVCSSADKAKGNLRVETSSDPPGAPGPISYILRNGTETGGDGRKRNYEVRVVSKDPKKCGGCSLWQANATVQMYTIAGLVSSWRPPPPADDAPAAFATETWKVAEITLVDGGSFEVGAHQDCELHTLATVERS